MKSKTKIFGLLLGVGFLLTLIPDFSAAATDVFGDIFSSETWTATSSPYIVRNASGASGVRITSGATVTIEPGVVVKFETGAQLWNQNGTFIANGTAALPIVFTALSDDSAGGDTNGDGSATTPSVGAWLRILLGSDSDSIQYTELRYALGCLGLGTADLSPTIKNNTIEKCTTGIDFSYTDPNIVIENNTIRNNGIGIRFLASNGVSFSGNNIIDNTSYGAYNISGNSQPVTANGNWWGNGAGPCVPANQPACSGFGDKITDGFVVASSLAQAYAAGPVAVAPRIDPLTGTSAGQQISKSSIPPKILKFRADPAEFKEGGDGVMLSWETEFADFVRLEGHGEVETSGEQKVYPESSQVYKLIAVGPGGQKTAELEVKMQPRDPVIIIPGILGSMKSGKKNEYVLDPILHTYDGLWEGLRSVGYEEGKTLFAFPYDWRKDNRETARLLGNRITEVLGICGCRKVDLVAHSMGGLVARYYIQNINDRTVDELIFLGTPHLGAPKAYLAWEGGEFGTFPIDLLTARVFRIEALAKGYINAVTYIQERIPSVGQLLPIFSYLSNYTTGELYIYEKCRDNFFTCNEFLEKLSEHTTDKYKSIRTYNIVNGEFTNTFIAFLLEKVSSSKWLHGKPYNFPKFDGILLGSGDGTVPIKSANWGSQMIINNNSEHSKLPFYAQSDVAKILINKEINPLRGTIIKRILFAAIKSPADIFITDPQGKRYGAEFGDDGLAYYSGTEDPEFITIPEPIDGEYTLTVTGTGEGKFEVEASLIGDDLEEETQTYKGEIKSGQQYQFGIQAASLNVPLKMEKRDTTAPETKLFLEGQKIKINEYYSGAIGILKAEDSEGQIEEIQYSLDLGNTWNTYKSKINFDQTGEYELLYRAKDQAGNVEFAKYNKLMITLPLPLPSREGSTTLLSPFPLAGEGGGEEVAISTTTEEIIPKAPPENANIESGQVLGASTERKEGLNQQGKILFWILIPLLIILFGYLLLRRRQK